MLFFNKKEINYELYAKHTIIRMLSNKQNNTNKYFFSFKPIIKIFFWFKKIKEEDLNFSKIFNHLILLWMITSQKARISNLNSVLNKGIKYFRYLYYIYIDNIYLFFNFLNEILFPIIQKNSKKIHNNENNYYLCSFSDFGSFTNLRLSSNLYLNSVHDKLFIFIKINKNINMNLSFYLNCLKL